MRILAGNEIHTVGKASNEVLGASPSPTHRDAEKNREKTCAFVAVHYFDSKY
jgi:hypothetical protein